MTQSQFWTLTIVVSLFSVVASWLGIYIAARTAFKRYTNERLWDKKSKTYDQILEDMYIRKEEIDNLISLAKDSTKAGTRGKHLNIEELTKTTDKMRGNVKQASSNNKKQISTGRFYISKKAIDLLDKFQNDKIYKTVPSSNKEIVDVFTEESKKVQGFIDEFIELGRKDLQS